MELIFATQNQNKVVEVAAKLKNKFKLQSLVDVGILEELAETSETLEGNALQKARYVYQKTGSNCFADDTGLEVEALGNEPGVYSARYAGIEKSSKKNMQKVLGKLEGKENRKAKFRTVLALIYEGKEYIFSGEVEGEILKEERGGEGFGYDPIFRPNGYLKSFAEMSREEKNQISHRAMAVAKLVDFLNDL